MLTFNLFDRFIAFNGGYIPPKYVNLTIPTGRVLRIVKTDTVALGMYCRQVSCFFNGQFEETKMGEPDYDKFAAEID